MNEKQKIKACKGLRAALKIGLISVIMHWRSICCKRNLRGCFRNAVGEIYEGIEASDISVQNIKVKKKWNGEAVVSYDINLQTFCQLLRIHLFLKRKKSYAG